MDLAANTPRAAGHYQEASNEPLLEAEVEAATSDNVNAPPALEGKWVSLSYRRVAMAKITVCICLMVVPLLSVVPVLIDNTYDVVCNSIGIPLDQCTSSDLANETVARFYAWETIFMSTLLLAMIPLVTGICERCGYRASFAWTSGMLTIVLVLTYVNFFVAPPHWSYWRLLSTDFFEACAGGVVVISNVSMLALFQLFPEPELRPRYTSLLVGTSGLVQTLSPSLGSFIARRYGADSLILLSAVVMALSGVYALFMGDMPEFKYSKTETSEALQVEKSKWGKVKTYVRSQLAGLSVLSFKHITNRATRMTAFALLFNKFATSELQTGGASAMLMYVKQHFNWDSSTIGLILTIASGSATFWGLGGFPALQRWLLKYYEVNPLGVDQLDLRFLVWSTAIRILGFIGMASAQTSQQMLLAIALKTQAALAGPTPMTSLMKLIPPSEGAALMTASSLIDSVCSIFIPSVMMQIYKLTLSWWPRLIFELEAVISGLQLLTLVFFVKIVTTTRASTPVV